MYFCKMKIEKKETDIDLDKIRLKCDSKIWTKSIYALVNLNNR